MKTSVMLFFVVVVLAVFSGFAQADSDIFSVNLWSRGKPPSPNVWNAAALATLQVAPDQAAGVGDWNTTGWENVQNASPFNKSVGPLTLHSLAGSSTATLTVLQMRNSSPYMWNTVRTTLIGDGNGALMDAHFVGTEDPYDGSNLFKMTVSDIPFEAYDVIIYLGGNQGQWGDGKGKIVFNGGPEQDFNLGENQEFSAFAEILDGVTPGNYIVYQGVTGPSFTVQVWGNGFNHLGPCGFQFGVLDTDAPTVSAGSDWITWSGEPVTLNDVLVTNNDPGAGALTLIWTTAPVEGVIVDFSDSQAEEPTVVITKSVPTDTALPVTLTLMATQLGKEPIESSMTIDVYNDACQAAVGSGITVIGPADFDTNCFTDLKDLAQMAAAWLVDFSLDEPVAR